MHEDVVIDGFAKAVFASGYADEVENAGAEDQLGPGPGGNWADVLPPVPVSAREFALRCIGGIEHANGRSLMVLLSDAWKADRLNPASLPADKLNEYGALFGHYLGMMTLGHGVGWFDDHAEFELVVPYREPDLECPERLVRRNQPEGVDSPGM